MFTLIGVAWTIRKSDKDRQVDEKKKAKPIFTFTMLNEEPENYEFGRYCFTEANGNFKCHCCFEIENSNLSAFIFKRIRHDGMWSEFVGNYTILPNGKCLLDFLFDSPLAYSWKPRITLEINTSIRSRCYTLLVMELMINSITP